MIYKNLNNLIAEAMKSKDELSLRVFRDIKTKFTEYEKSKEGNSIDEVVEIQILNKMYKQREDSAKQYTEAGREALAAKEHLEMRLIKEYLPDIPTNKDIEAHIDLYAAENNLLEWVFVPTLGVEIPNIAIPKKKMGAVIKYVKEQLPLADGKVISELIKPKLI